MIRDDRRSAAAAVEHIDPLDGSLAARGIPVDGPVESLYEHRLSGTARDARLVEVFLHASASVSAAVVAKEIGVRVTTVHRWRSTGGERISATVRDSIVAYLARWSLRSEYPLEQI